MAIFAGYFRTRISKDNFLVLSYFIVPWPLITNIHVCTLVSSLNIPVSELAGFFSDTTASFSVSARHCTPATSSHITFTFYCTCIFTVTSLSHRASVVMFYTHNK